MNLDFGILWIEDSYSAAEEESLKRRVLDAGFLARIEAIPNGMNIEELARQHQLYHRYDMILLDYRLKDENGDDLAPRVRELFPSTTILFYSGSVEEEELRRMMADRQVEGVYCSARPRFIARTGMLIDQTARALDRLSGMRGLAMRVVAECDALMTAAMLAMCNLDPNCSAKMTDLDKDVYEFIDGLKKKYEDAATGSDLDSRLATRAVDSMKLFKHFRRLIKVAAKNPAYLKLNDEQVERLRELNNTSSTYEKAVLRKRNVLGHVVEVQKEEGWVLEGSSEISVRDFADIRRGFATHIDAFREMQELVTALNR